MRSSIRLFRGVLVGALLALAAGSSLASGPDAVARYRKGRQLIEQRQYQEALMELEKSHAQMPSPNTLLLIAHANRELGKLEVAAAQYERVIEDAQAKVQAGEPRFRMTADDARSWLDKISKDLGWLVVSVTHAPADVVVRVGDAVVQPTTTNNSTLSFNKVWVRPGEVVVTADAPGQAQRRISVDVPRGGPATVVLDLSAIAESDKPSGEAVASAGDTVPGGDSGTRSIPTGSWITGGIGAAGLVAFGVFGSMARSKASQLDECAPRCPETERSTADAGKRDQTIANVGLVVAGIGFATAVGIYVWQPDSSPGQPSVGVSVVPGGMQVAGSF